MKAQPTEKPAAERKPSLPDEPTFSVRNLGSVRTGSFTQKPLTLFCGPNNTGKTWTMYSLYYWRQLLKQITEDKYYRRTWWKQFAKEEDKNFPNPTEFNLTVSKTLSELFNAPAEELKDARFELDLPSWLQTTTESKSLSDVFLMPAERNGLHLFFRELSVKRPALLHHASKEKIDINQLLIDVIRSRYATPIANYIDWLNSLPDIRKSKPNYPLIPTGRHALDNILPDIQKSKDFHRFAEELKKELAGGAYKVDRDGNIEFKPYQTKRDGKTTPTMGLHLTSSTVKSLFGLWFYLEHQARKGSILMIDEPELNIHPENQRKIARLFARLVNNGLNIVISTHSDYIVREINSLIMLSQDANKHLRKQHKYKDEEILKREQVGAYLFDNHIIEHFSITRDDGIHATTFDDVIKDLNNVNNDIFYTLQEQKTPSTND